MSTPTSLWVVTFVVAIGGTYFVTKAHAETETALQVAAELRSFRQREQATLATLAEERRAHASQRSRCLPSANVEPAPTTTRSNARRNRPTPRVERQELGDLDTRDPIEGLER